MFVYDLRTLVTFVMLDYFTVEFSEVYTVQITHFHSLSNRPSKIFMTDQLLPEGSLVIVKDVLVRSPPTPHPTIFERSK